MIGSRCGVLCGGCEFQKSIGCKGCANIEKPFWSDSCPVKSCCEGKGYAHCGQCEVFPCQVLVRSAYDPRQGDGGLRIEQCRKWREEA